LKIPLARITSGLKPTPSSAIVRPKFDRQRSERLDHVFADSGGSSLRWNSISTSFRNASSSGFAIGYSVGAAPDALPEVGIDDHLMKELAGTMDGC